MTSHPKKMAKKWYKQSFKSEWLLDDDFKAVVPKLFGLRAEFGSSKIFAGRVAP